MYVSSLAMCSTDCIIICCRSGPFTRILKLLASKTQGLNQHPDHPTAALSTPQHPRAPQPRAPQRYAWNPKAPHPVTPLCSSVQVLARVCHRPEGRQDPRWRGVYPTLALAYPAKMQQYKSTPTPKPISNADLPNPTLSLTPPAW